MKTNMNSFQFNDNGSGLIAGIGSALIDILIFESDAFIEKTGAAPGGMTYVDKDFAERTLAVSANNPEMVPGDDQPADDPTPVISDATWSVRTGTKSSPMTMSGTR